MSLLSGAGGQVDEFPPWVLLALQLSDNTPAAVETDVLLQELVTAASHCCDVTFLWPLLFVMSWKSLRNYRSSHFMLSETGFGSFVMLRTSEDYCNINGYEAD